jgi:predicted N-acetyltransferase YhbS
MLTIRTLQADDLDFAWQLSSAAGWNQTGADWRRFLQLAPQGCFLASSGSQRVGTVTTCQFGSVGWIGMMLVDDAWRRRGIGRALMQRALEYLDSRGARTVRLDATHLGAPLYQRLGFVTQFRLQRYAGRVLREDRRDEERRVRVFQTADQAAIAALDQQIVGYDRQGLLDALWRCDADRCRVLESDDGLVGYVASRAGRLAAFVGPCIATRDRWGALLLQQALADYQGQEVFVDVPEANRCAAGVVQSAGLLPAREFQRMARGEQEIENLEGLFASSGPEMG